MKLRKPVAYIKITETHSGLGWHQEGDVTFSQDKIDISAFQLGRIWYRVKWAVESVLDDKCCAKQENEQDNRNTSSSCYCKKCRDSRVSEEELEYGWFYHLATLEKPLRARCEHLQW